MSSRSHLAKSFKAPLRNQNENCWKAYFDEARRNIMALKDPAGRPVLESAWKTGFLGCIVFMQSIEHISDYLVVHNSMRVFSENDTTETDDESEMRPAELTGIVNSSDGSEYVLPADIRCAAHTLNLVATSNSAAAELDAQH
ncbi:hypothetical protein HPB50_020614 [Hyalomma asiaticum]|uniref:Uncharacterized protein n=1 Tax=Hyalomma asiaticum TaxID=266040 RepID=A0ACB7SSB3_HYAAI|nr:hypothetical protein HPB50_020614 [Hyalomma asiaticum]